MDHIVAGHNNLCAWYIHHGFAQFSDSEIRGSRAFYLLLVMARAEVAPTMLCTVDLCQVCLYSELDPIDVS